MFRTLLLTLSIVGAACATSKDTLAGGEPGQSGSLPIATSSDEAMDASAVVASWGKGGQITYGVLHQEIEGQLRMMEIEHRLQRYDTMTQTLEHLVVQQLLEAEVKERGLADIDALLAEEVEKKVQPPAEEEVQAYYDMVARQLGGASLDDARSFLEQELVRRAQGERYRAYVEELKETVGVSWHLPYPDLPRVELDIADTDPILGNPDAPVTIVQFAEYQCPYCNRVAPTLKRVLETYEGKVRLIYKDFPLQGHGRAFPAAVAAHCAGEQDKYWEMNELLLGNQQALDDASLLGYGRQLGLDMGAYETCLGSDRYDETIRQGLEQGRQVGVSATPSFFVNGVLVAGAQPFERFAAIIEQETATR